MPQGKLHIPGPGPSAQPLCGRQLNNHRTSSSQLADLVTYAATADEFMQALRAGKSCRHCARVSGLLPALRRTSRDETGEDSDNE